MSQLPDFATHVVTNQPPPLLPFDAWQSDAPLREALAREAPDTDIAPLADYGRRVGGELSEWGFLANRNRPVLHTHSRYGERIDQVEFHPAYHQLMQAAIGAGVHSLGWEGRPGDQVRRAALSYLHHQAEAGTSCPLTMTYAAVPVLRQGGAGLAPWLERACSREYDARFVPGLDKPGVTLGMGMTEKQGGSDVRANATRAEPLGGGRYRLVGHKWFFSAPMCDAFLVLAQAPDGLSCFLLPRFREDGSRNALRIVRLKDKLGNWANASSEVEFEGAEAQRIGDEGRGVATILEMVSLTRLDCMLGSAAEMRRALVEALHHARHRQAFGRPLIDQPLMREVLADLALEVEASVALAFRVAAAIDRAADSPAEAALARIATALGKFWICKRAPALVNEAQECLGGAGYVEESIMPRLYREAPLNSIWEGCGNIQCLDVLRAQQREPASAEALAAELDRAAGRHPDYDAALAACRAQLAALGNDPEGGQRLARQLGQRLAQCLQASLLLRAEPALGAAFSAARLGAGRGAIYGGSALAEVEECLFTRAWG
ncbi:isovaleryl-CoA dehydrogenase [Pseudomarimonas salicorniae]|uniref:Isovaleryl-CoA dehydrogenase n=1 Tax=Pseudomarimonas salicorniae TaxID=2933270 RepID=A0ABT0GJ40_9GAMM|nr:isovaleryl-CoA dehydrogenase [Lysobacter sp. CAU 1642]MCK7594224.1 isovaleryl-CoA dehydrogenase [Lysobacter sp. CAU 1642]